MSSPVEDEDGEEQQSDVESGGSIGRRGFLGGVAGGAVATVGVTGAASGQEAPVVTMRSNEFDPVGLHVEPGTTVRFDIEDGSHSATAYEDRIPEEADPFDSGTISAGGFEHTFESPGTYDYYCIPHQSVGMVGRIVVGEPGGPAEASSIPDGDVPDSGTIVDAGAVAAEEFSGDGQGGHGRKGSGTMDGLMVLMPIGVITLLLGTAGGVGYLITQRRGRGPAASKSAMELLEERYATGEIDDDEFHHRREQLQEPE